jgi:hypothetical protein
MACSRRPSVTNIKLMCTCAPREELGEGISVLLHSFLTSEIERNEWTGSRPGHFTPTEKALTYAWQKGLNFTLIVGRTSSFWIVRQSALVVVYRRFGIAYGHIEGFNRFLGLEPLKWEKKSEKDLIDTAVESSLDNCNFPGLLKSFLSLSVALREQVEVYRDLKPTREYVLCLCFM